ncbi:MAG TPA: GrpB family protein [Candidatus Tumulicola sp.]
MIRIALRKHDPEWARRYELHEARLRTALGDRPASIEHIGSTAIPGLAAKPVVDIIVGGIDPHDCPARAALERAGYAVVVDEDGHRMYAPADRSAHVHFWSDARETERHILFRDWLRDRVDDRALYEDVKRRLALRPWNDANEYAQAKTAVIESILKRARGAPDGPRIDTFARLLLETLPADANVLEIGAGEGRLATRLAVAGHHVVALDRELRSSFPIAEIAFEEYVAPPATFECVAAALVLHHVNCLEATLEKVAILLKPGGIVAIDDYGWERSGDPTFRTDRASLHTSASMLEALRRIFEEIYYRDHAYFDDGAGDDALAFTFIGRRRS